MEAKDAQADVWTIRRVITWATDDLKKRGSSSPRLDVELLLCKVLEIDRVALLIQADKPLDKTELASYRALHVRRRAGEPVAYLLGVREFYGRTFRVDARVLIPRPDTEVLVEVALTRTRALSLSARVLDACTGSGCVAITLAKERPTTRVIGTDISDGALAVARDNVVRLGAAHNTGFVRTDLFRGIEGPFDLITSNPPYIPDAEIAELMVDVRAYEPRLALAGGGDGLSFVRRIAEEAPQLLTRGGVLAVEIGAGQAGDAASILEAKGFTGLQKARDMAGIERVVSGIWG